MVFFIVTIIRNKTFHIFMYLCKLFIKNNELTFEFK